MDIFLKIIGILLPIIIMVASITQKRRLANMPSENPLREAEIYLAYGRKKEAKVILEDYLLSKPGDKHALELLQRTI